MCAINGFFFIVSFLFVIFGIMNAGVGGCVCM